MILETARLVLRPVAPDDHGTLHGIFTQPGVRRFLFDNEIIPPERTAEIIQRSDLLFREQRFGLWLARQASSPEVALGFGAFWYFRDPPELELLYGVSDVSVKQGYGREIARAVVDYGFTHLAMTEIRASTDAGHTASRRLLEDLGFRFQRRARATGLDSAFYSAARTHKR